MMPCGIVPTAILVDLSVDILNSKVRYQPSLRYSEDCVVITATHAEGFAQPGDLGKEVMSVYMIMLH